MDENNCMNNLLKYICLLQDNSTNNCNRLCSNNYNTRVLQIYKKNGELLEINNSTYYRVMNVKNNCCTLLLLSLNNSTFSSLNEFITISTNCISAIRCYEDIIINF